MLYSGKLISSGTVYIVCTVQWSADDDGTCCIILTHNAPFLPSIKKTADQKQAGPYCLIYLVSS